MKHFAIASMSIRRSNFPYTCPGLGDRVHSVLLGYQYGLKHGQPCTIHITSDKNGKPRKKRSWTEIVSLFPEGSVQVVAHDVKGLPDVEWRAYLAEKGFETEAYCYADTFKENVLDRRVPLDAAELLREYPRLDPPEKAVTILPSKFITTQWDSSGPGWGRKLAREWIEKIMGKYEDEGYKIVVVGGDSESETLRNSVRHIAFAMSEADLHVGVDSGMMHLAGLYRKPEEVHIYTSKFISHHTVRARNSGSIINRYYENRNTG